MCASGRCPCATTVVLWNDSKKHYLAIDAKCNRYDCKYCGNKRRQEKIDRAEIGIFLSRWQLTIAKSPKERESLTRRLNYQKLEYISVAHRTTEGSEHDKVFFVYHQPMEATAKYPDQTPSISGNAALQQIKGLIGSSSLSDVRFSRCFPMDLDEALRRSAPKEYVVAAVTPMSFEAVQKTAQALTGYYIRQNAVAPTQAIEPLFGRIMNRIIKKPVVEIVHKEKSNKKARKRRRRWPPIYRVDKSCRESIDPTG